MDLGLTFLNPNDDWERTCAVCSRTIRKGELGTQTEPTDLPIGEYSFRMYLVWHDECRERYFEEGEET